MSIKYTHKFDNIIFMWYISNMNSLFLLNYSDSFLKIFMIIFSVVIFAITISIFIVLAIKTRKRMKIEMEKIKNMKNINNIDDLSKKNEMIACPYCGAKYSSDKEKCPTCGALNLK